ncbi:unknown [Clostridium sp. CAG:921]|nr:unknown [Clostridium sp. CAG:921]
MSYASWLFSQYNCINPQSLTPIESEWSLCMFNGADNARLAQINVSGNLIPDAIYNISNIYASPCDEVALITLLPAADAPIHADIALCSLSTAINSELTEPFETKFEKY